MKKILLYIIITHILTLSAYAAELKDCSVYSKFNPNYFTCKTANFAKDTTNYQNKEWSKEKNKFIKKKNKFIKKKNQFIKKKD
jgi:hypothetical protein